MKKALIVGSESEVMSESIAHCCSNILLLHADRRMDSQNVLCSDIESWVYFATFFIFFIP
jgi:hypothetical protein